MKSLSTLLFSLLLPLLFLAGCAASPTHIQTSLAECNEDYRSLSNEMRDLRQALRDPGYSTVAVTETPLVTGSNAVQKTSMTSEVLEGLLKQFGFDPSELHTNAYMFTLSSARVVVFNRGESLRIYAGFHATPSLELINKWNQKTRFSRAYLDKEGDAVVEFDLDLEDGWSEDNIKGFINTFGMIVGAYRLFLKEEEAESRRSASLAL